MLPRVLWFFLNLPEYWYPDEFLPLIRCFKILSWEDLACWPFEQILRPLPQIRDGELLNCSPRCFVSYHNLPEFWYPVAFVPLICFSQVLSEKMLLERSTDFACWPEQNFRPLTLVKGWRMVELQPKVLCFISQLTWILISCCNIPSNLLYHNLPEFWYPDAFVPLIFFFKFLSEKCCSNCQQIWLVDKIFDLLP